MTVHSARLDLSAEPPAAPALAMGLLLAPGRAFGSLAGARVLRSLSELREAQPALLGLYLLGWDAAQAEQAILAWRASPQWYRPAFVAQDMACPAAGDGALDYAQAVQDSMRIEQLRSALPLDAQTLQFDERLLYYLYLREPQELVPVCDRHSRQLYRYPLAEALGPDSGDVGSWIASLSRRELLQPTRLLDRTRHCRSCSSAHLHYLDVCPQCRSLEIRASDAIHCFTCGHVAAQEDFASAGALACPKCQARLRHVGVDYDKPLTKLACGSCHHAFIEAAVVVRCLDCATVTEPELLDVRQVHALRLSPAGRAALRAGQVQDALAALDNANYVVPHFFRRMLDAAIVTQARHRALTFSLVLVEFTNTQEFIAAQGTARTYLVLDELGKRLRELLRSTDLTTRTADTLLWVYLPFSSGAGFAARVERLLHEVMPSQERTALRARISHLEAPDGLQPGEGAQALMARLHDTVEA